MKKISWMEWTIIIAIIVILAVIIFLPLGKMLTKIINANENYQVVAEGWLERVEYTYAKDGRPVTIIYFYDDVSGYSSYEMFGKHYPIPFTKGTKIRISKHDTSYEYKIEQTY